MLHQLFAASTLEVDRSVITAGLLVLAGLIDVVVGTEVPADLILRPRTQVTSLYCAQTSHKITHRLRKNDLS
jgi:hypothetical protein